MIEKFNLAALYPEILLVVMTIAIAMIDLFVKSPRRTLTYVLSLLTMAVVAVLQAHDAMSGTTVYSFGNMVVSDPMGNWLKCFSTLAVFVTLVYGRPYAADRDMLKYGGELFTLGLFALLGMYVMISGNNFLVLYLGVELLALSSYALVALRRDSTTASEAAMKYFVLGSLGSGFLLYGMSMIYGGTGSLDITTVFKAVASGQINHKVLILGLVFLVCGLGFKFGVVPFHMWVPDVYQGAPTVVTLMIGGAHKLAAFTLAGALAGLAGYLWAAQTGFINPELMGFHMSAHAIMMVILGGMGNFAGAAIGAFSFEYLLHLFKDLPAIQAFGGNFQTGKHWQMWMGLFIVALVILAPRGILGLVSKWLAKKDVVQKESEK